MSRTDRPSSRPLFTVVTVVFNGARTIDETIRSIENQTFRDFEYIVLDGASTDQTPAILQAHASSLDHWSSEPDTGIYNAWNKSLRLARGEWIAFLGADDTYYPDALEQYARAIKALPDQRTQYVSSRVELVKQGKIVRIIGASWSWPSFSHHMTIAHVGSMHHRSLFQEYGQFDESYRVCADYELLLRPRSKLRYAFLDRVTARMSFGGISNSNTRVALAEQARAKRTAGGRPAWRCGVEWGTAHLKNRCRSLLWY